MLVQKIGFTHKNHQTNSAQSQNYMTKVNSNSVGDTVSFGTNVFPETEKIFLEVVELMKKKQSIFNLRTKKIKVMSVDGEKITLIKRKKEGFFDLSVDGKKPLTIHYFHNEGSIADTMDEWRQDGRGIVGNSNIESFNERIQKYLKALLPKKK